MSYCQIWYTGKALATLLPDWISTGMCSTGNTHPPPSKYPLPFGARYFHDSQLTPQFFHVFCLCIKTRISFVVGEFLRTVLRSPAAVFKGSWIAFKSSYWRVRIGSSKEEPRLSSRFAFICCVAILPQLYGIPYLFWIVSFPHPYGLPICLIEIPCWHHFLYMSFSLYSYIYKTSDTRIVHVHHT